MRSAIAGPDRSGPGITRSAPAATPAWARPQALAWNIGTTGRIRSDSPMPNESAVIAAHRVQERAAMAVDDALRVARRAARVAHAGGAVLVVDVELDRGRRRRAGPRRRAARGRRGRRGCRPCRRPSARGACTPSNVLSSGASRPSSERSTKITSSSAWLTMYVSCSGNSRMFSVCSTRPVHGAAKYSSRWRDVFQANVATRPSAEIPSVSSTPPRRRVRSAHSAYVMCSRPVARRRRHPLVPEVPLGPLEQVRDRQRHVLHQPLHEQRR